MTFIIVGVVVMALVCSRIGLLLGEEKGRAPLGFLLGFLFGVVGLF